MLNGIRAIKHIQKYEELYGFTFAHITIELVDYLEDLAAKITAFLEFFTKGLPDAGIYILAVKTTGGNKAIQSALTGSDNSPANISPALVYSAGIMIMGVENPVTGQDPLVTFFENLLSIDFQPIGFTEPPEESEEDKKE